MYQVVYHLCNLKGRTYKWLFDKLKTRKWWRWVHPSPSNWSILKLEVGFDLRGGKLGFGSVKAKATKTLWSITLLSWIDFYLWLLLYQSTTVLIHVCDFTLNIHIAYFSFLFSLFPAIFLPGIFTTWLEKHTKELRIQLWTSHIYTSFIRFPILADIWPKMVQN